jgi:pentatricopeptide repeat protein
VTSLPHILHIDFLPFLLTSGQQWKLALQVLEEMKKTFGPNVIAYSAAISALSKGQQWEKAWELFCEIEASGEKLSVVTYNATMTALEKGLQASTGGRCSSHHLLCISML